MSIWEDVAREIVLTVVVGVAIAWWKMRRRRAAQAESTVGGPELARARREAAEGRLSPLVRLLDRTEDPVARALYLDEASAHLDLEKVLFWAKSAPKGPTVSLLLAEAHLAAARGMRIDDAARSVRESNVPAYSGHLNTAFALLEEASEGRPEDPVPWYRRVRIGRFLYVDEDDVQDWLQEAIARDPDCFVGHLEWASYIGPNWHGSEERMTGYVQATVAAASPGSLRPALVFHAQLESFGARASKLAFRQALAALKSPEAKVEADHASAQLFEDGPPLPRIHALWARSFAAYQAYLADRHAELRGHLAALDGAFTRVPWASDTKHPGKRFSDATHEANPD